MPLPAHRRSPRAALALSLVLLGAAAAPARAQWSVFEADSLLAAGRLPQAQRAYYAASRARTRDPAARAALGRFLAARGALRIGATLLEEAMQFGGDTTAIARALAPTYEAVGDYRKLAVLPRSPLSAPERQRAAWIGANQQPMEFADTVAIVEYRPASGGTTLGVTTLLVGARRIDVAIDPAAHGLRLRGAAARSRDSMRVFGRHDDDAVAVIPELHLGDVVLSNIAATLDRGKPRTSDDTLSVIGLDMLWRFAPSFDPGARTITLRRSGEIGAATRGNRLPFLLDATGLRLLSDGAWTSATPLLVGRRWTFDARHGDVILQ